MRGFNVFFPQGVAVSLTPPKSSLKIFVKMFLSNPAFKSVCCVPHLYIPSSNENPYAKPDWGWGALRPL